ncbi:hypothetical protein MTO96_037591 [Rhipicephalus appendiculatus]
MIDETPKPEEKVQQLDVLVRFYSDSAGCVVVEHLQSFNLGHATADIMFSCIQEAIAEVPNQNLICFFTDGPNVMKSLKKKVKELSPHLLDIGECTLHKVHNAFSVGLHAFAKDLDTFVIDVHSYFKSAARNADFKEVQRNLGLPALEFLRHVSSRWLTLLPGVERIVEQFEALRVFFLKKRAVRTVASTRHERLPAAFCDKSLQVNLLFIKNAAKLFQNYETLFQNTEPLLHILYEEMVVLVKQVLGRFMRQDSFAKLCGVELKVLDIHESATWLQKPELGQDTEEALHSWPSCERKNMYIRARAFYIACAAHLLSRLPLDNKILQHLKFLNPRHRSCSMSLRHVACALPQVISPSEVSGLIDEWNKLVCEACDWDPEGNLTVHWKKVFSLKNANSRDYKYEKLVRLVKAVLCVPHGNADCERGFSENKFLLQHRSSMSITSVTALRQTKAYLRRYDGVGTKVEITAPLLKSVREARQRNLERLKSEQDTMRRLKRKHENEKLDSDERTVLIDEKHDLLDRVSSLKSLLANAQDLISVGLKNKEMGKVESGNVLLEEANTALPKVLNRIEEIDAMLLKRK